MVVVFNATICCRETCCSNNSGLEKHCKQYEIICVYTVECLLMGSKSHLFSTLWIERFMDRLLDKRGAGQKSTNDLEIG